MQKILIVIPARYASSRLPGKPLIDIHGKTMISRVWDIATSAARKLNDLVICNCVVSTEDSKIVDYCSSMGIDCVLTTDDCKSGTDRVLETIPLMDFIPDFVINLQGDNPLCPPWFIEDLIRAYIENPSFDIFTPCVNLSWDELKTLEEQKKTTPLSGTTAIVSLPKSANRFESIENNNIFNAIWFSKQIIPSIRNKNKLSKLMKKSPVLRHIGLYGYSAQALTTLSSLPITLYNDSEDLEQLRFIENDLKVAAVKVDYRGRKGMSGVDSPEDVVRAVSILEEFGEY